MECTCCKGTSTHFRVGGGHELVGGVYGGAIRRQHQKLERQLRTAKTCAKIWCSGRYLAEGQPPVATKLTFQAVFGPQPPSRPTPKVMDFV